MSKTLVAYFSAGGVTADVAKQLAGALGAGLYEIRPEVPYSQADLDWRDPRSRSSIEMKDKSFRPALAARDAALDGVDTLYLGFPIWWYVAPTIVNSFLEAYDFSGKTLILFATAGSSDWGNTAAELAPSCPGAVIREGKVFRGRFGPEDVKRWLESL